MNLILFMLFFQFPVTALATLFSAFVMTQVWEILVVGSGFTDITIPLATAVGFAGVVTIPFYGIVCYISDIHSYVNKKKAGYNPYVHGIAFPLTIAFIGLVSWGMANVWAYFLL